MNTTIRTKEQLMADAIWKTVMSGYIEGNKDKVIDLSKEFITESEFELIKEKVDSILSKYNKVYDFKYQLNLV